MARIRGSDTKPELRLRQRLWAEGFRYRLQYRTPGGRPDLAFPGPKLAVFVDGCFWHGCPDHYVRPRSRQDFWSHKLSENWDRDRRQTLALDASGWASLRFWEHEIWEDLDGVVASIAAALASGPPTASWTRWQVVEVVEIPVSEGPANLERRVMRSLRGPDESLVIERPRNTRKWTVR